MSIDINWESLTGGADGEDFAETIRHFIHERFQQIALPKFIKSVHVHSFQFGKIGPELELKDICDPLPDFYEDDGEAEEDAEEEEEEESVETKYLDSRDPQLLATRNGLSKATDQLDGQPDANPPVEPLAHDSHEQSSRPRLNVNVRLPPARPSWSPHDSTGPVLSRSSTPGIPGGTSNLNYFHMPIGAGLSGATTPLAAFSGASFVNSWSEHHPMPWHLTGDGVNPALRPGNASTSPFEQSLSQMTRSPLDRWHNNNRLDSLGPISESQQPDSESGYIQPDTPKERSTNDVQIVARVKYSGDIQLSLTAEILLDYPMPSFVGIPLELNVTGMTFDGVAILAYIKAKAHFCFLSPEDADALIGGESMVEIRSNETQGESPQPKRHRVGGLFEQIKVESQIGRKSDGKQVLKNVGKVESFVLEQVRRIFEDELVYPSFWTFLV